MRDNPSASPTRPPDLASVNAVGSNHLTWEPEKSSQEQQCGPILDGTLDDCIQKVIAKPSSTHHLYEIHTAPQGDLIGAVLSETSFREIARLREFHQLLQARRNSC